MTDVKIGNCLIGDSQPCFISLEAGGTWTSFEDAKKMIEAAALAGANAVKFQTFLPGDSDRMMAQRDIKIDFTTPTGKKQEVVHQVLKRRELKKEQWSELISLSKNLKINFITTPVFPETIDFLKNENIEAIKIAKGDINNVILIDYAAKTGLPIILDGREKFEDVDKAVKICEKNNNKQIIIMHCPSGYPAENAGVHLNAITAIRQKYSYPVGFSDHSPGDIMNYAGVALGASKNEKTMTSDKTKEEVEHFMSLELDELKNFVTQIRDLELAMGDSKVLMTSRVSEDARRSLVAKTKILKGEKLEQVVFLSPLISSFCLHSGNKYLLGISLLLNKGSSDC